MSALVDYQAVLSAEARLARLEARVARLEILLECQGPPTIEVGKPGSKPSYYWNGLELVPDRINSYAA